MNRFTKFLHKRNLKFTRKSNTTLAQDAKPMLTINDIPHPRSLPIFGTKFDLIAAGSGKQLHEYIDRRHKKLGPIFYEQLGGSTKMVFISNPDVIKALFLNLEGKYPIHILPDPWILYGKLYGNKRGLFFMDGEEWLNNRRVTNKHLLRDDSVKWMTNPVLSTVEKFIKSWRDKVQNKSFIPKLESDFYKFSTDAQKIVSEMLQNRDENNGLIKRLLNENLSDDTITRIVADFVIAAGDTTAYTSLWILHLVSNRQDLITEIRTKDRSYVKNIVKESMRLYPVAPFLTRILTKESILDDYKLDVGTPIIASIYTSGRDERNFSQSDKFLPYRWDRSDSRREELTNHVPSASLPFALGARSCVGRKIAMLQITELIYQIVNQFDLKSLNETEVKPITSQVLVPNKDIKIAVSLRSSEIKEEHKL